MLQQACLVAIGSALGGVARWSVDLWIGRLLGGAFPFGTLLINVTGSFFLGWFATVLSKPSRGLLSANLSAEQLRFLVAVGFTGSARHFPPLSSRATTFCGTANRWRQSHTSPAACSSGCSLFEWEFR